jgi:hypothetical protein
VREIRSGVASDSQLSPVFLSLSASLLLSSSRCCVVVLLSSFRLVFWTLTVGDMSSLIGLSAHALDCGVAMSIRLCSASSYQSSVPESVESMFAASKAPVYDVYSAGATRDLRFEVNSIAKSVHHTSVRRRPSEARWRCHTAVSSGLFRRKPPRTHV